LDTDNYYKGLHSIKSRLTIKVIHNSVESSQVKQLYFT